MSLKKFNVKAGLSVGPSIIDVIDANGNATFNTIDGTFIGTFNGTISNADYATTAGSSSTASAVTTNAQPNITSVGTLTTLAVTGTTSLGAVGNIAITGGNAGQVLTTNGSGTLSWVNQGLKYSREVHVDPTVGSDTTGVGSYDKPFATIAKAQTIITSGATLYLHVGGYTENVTWTQPNCDIIGISAGGMVNTTGTWTVGVQAGSSVRIKDVSFNGAFTQNGAGRIILQSSYLRSTFTKSSGEYTQFDDTDAAGTGIAINSGGTVVFNGGSQNFISVANASAVVSVMNTIATASITVTAGTVVTADSYLYAVSNTGNAVTTSAGTAMYMYNSRCIAPNSTVARVSLAGFWTANDTQYDKANSTLTGYNLSTISHFDAIVTQATISATGNISGGNITTSNYVKTSPKTVASLASAATVGAGTRSFVSDANTTTFGSIVGGSGANSVPVWSNGANWLVG